MVRKHLRRHKPLGWAAMNRWLRYGLIMGPLLAILPAPLAWAGGSIAFYYADQPPVDELAMFDQIVVESEYLDPGQIEQLQKQGSRLFAYVSLGEARRNRPWYAEVQREWILGENKAWNSDIMNLAHAGWQDFVLERLIGPLVTTGFQGIFLDTLDSYRILADTPEKLKRQRDGLIHLIQTIHQRFPALKILVNRGFEVVDAIAPYVQGVVAESMFRTWNPETRTYEKVPQEDSSWLMAKLEAVRKLGLDVYVIDYVHPADRDLARSTARRIHDLGFVPWVANPRLDMLGVGEIESVPRRVLVIYDSEEAELAYHQAHRYLAAPLEYLGYRVDYQDVRAGLPAFSLKGRYAGVVCWFTDRRMPAQRRFTRWLIRQIDEAVPLAFLQSFGMEPDNQLLERLGLVRVEGKIQRPIKIRVEDSMAAMEARPRPLSRGLTPVRSLHPDARIHEQIEDHRGERMDVILTDSWGGFALSPYVLEMGLDQHARWRLDIFAFLEEALHLEAIPAFDVTTENGMRLMMSHIDGDGIASRALMPGSPLSIRVIHEQILKRYPIPVTVSVIVSEIERQGLYPDRAAEMQRVARKIFQLPHVEIASHTYSHPFSWSQAEAEGKAHLDVPGYSFSLEKEIDGSVRYINRKLAPRNKPVRVFLWSGDALPGESAVRRVREIGLRNLNGGNTVMTLDHPSLTDVSSVGRPVGHELQVYAPVMNENIYTHHWTRPRYGFERVIETFRLTDQPRRLKPIDIYYHFYSGSEIASLNALKKVLDWAMRQETLPLWISEYVDRVRAWMHAGIARNLAGDWLLHVPPPLGTVRLPRSLGWPDLQASRGVIGMRDIPQGRYLHLKPAEGTFVRLHLTGNRPVLPHLVYANGFVEQWHRDGRRIRMRLRGHVPLRFAMNRRCILHQGKKRTLPRANGSLYTFSLDRKDTGLALLVCR